MISEYSASWAANRRDVGWAILGLTWAVALASPSPLVDDDLAVLLLGAAGCFGVAALVALTRLGCRLAFGNS